MLTREEKERLVIDLYNQDKTIRDIVKELRMSFRDIGAILKKSGEKEEDEEEVNNSLSKRKDLLKLAVSSVIESIRRDPTKYNFLINSSRQYAASHPYIDVYRTLILDEAQKVFELIVQDLTGRIINEAALTTH